MQLIPPALVPAINGFLQQQGVGGIFTSDGSLNSSAAVSLFFDRVTVQTAITPDINFAINANGPPPSRAEQELLGQLRPTVTLTGRAGTVTVAPYGVPQGQRSWLPIALFGAGAVLFVGWLVFGGGRSGKRLRRYKRN